MNLDGERMPEGTCLFESSQHQKAKAENYSKNSIGRFLSRQEPKNSTDSFSAFPLLARLFIDVSFVFDVLFLISVLDFGNLVFVQRRILEVSNQVRDLKPSNRHQFQRN